MTDQGGWNGLRRYVENNACSADGVVLRSRSAREDRIGTIKGHVREVSLEQISRSVGYTGNRLAIGGHEVAEIDCKRAGNTRTKRTSEEAKRDRVQRWRHRCKGIGAGDTRTCGAFDGRPNAETDIGRIGMRGGPADGADQRVAGYRGGEVVCAPDDSCVGIRSECEGQGHSEV